MINYRPGPAGASLLASRSAVKGIMGPVGGGKSTVALMDLVASAVRQKPYDNVRRTKCIILRNTVAQLKSTIKPIIDQWLCQMADNKLGAWRLTDGVFHMRFKMPDHTVVDSEFWLMAADTPDDVRRLLSVECSHLWVEEAREINQEVFRGARGRVNRYPNIAMGGVTDAHTVFSTNPPNKETYWFDVINEPPEGWDVFCQPPAILHDGTLNPDAENLENLAPGYYENLMSGASEEWIDVYLKNKFGTGGFGKPVYRATFKADWHVAKEPLRAVTASVNPLIIGMDNGLQAACTISQMDMTGRINVLDEVYVPEDTTMGVDRFMDTMVIPRLREKWPFRPENILFVLDPACWQRSQANEVSIAQIVKSRGYNIVRAPTNDPERRIAAVETLLTRAIDGGPGMLISPTCKYLISGLEGGYRYKMNKDGGNTLQVDKNHHSHLCESHQYMSTHFVGADLPGSYGNRRKTFEIKPHRYRYA